MTRLRDIDLGGIDLSGIRLGWTRDTPSPPLPEEGYLRVSPGTTAWVTEETAASFRVESDLGWRVE